MSFPYKWFLSLMTGATILFGAWWYFNQSPIQEFNYDRDAAEIKKIFERDLYWLTTSPDYSPEFMLKTKSPSQYDIRYFGQLQIRVLREKGSLVGFTAYYMKTATLGFILFMDVNPEFRGKRYGEILIRYDFEDLKRRGATRVELFTRINNERALKLYKRVGMVETSYVEDWGVYLAKDL